jgi:Flp pilus assembly protein TadG
MAMSLSFKKLGFVSGWKKFFKHQRGNVSIMFGIAAVPMFLAGGAAIDYERAINAKTMLQASLDSAALYAASLTATDDPTLTIKSKPYVVTNYNNVGEAAMTSYSAHFDPTASTIQVDGQVAMKTWFMAIVGQTDLTVTASSTVQRSGLNMEVSLVLDNTGSMGWYGGTPIASLISAAGKFVDTVMPSTQGIFYTKMAIVPYNNSVNMGSLAAAVTARGSVLTGTSTSPGYEYYRYNSADGAGLIKRQITQCVTERTGVNAYADVAASTSPVGLQYNGASNPCQVVPYMPLSTNKTALKNKISSMTASNYTAGHVGLAWGWYTLSPIFGIFSGESIPAGYDKLTTQVKSEKVKKIMILMTDGEFNSAYVNGVFSNQSPYANYQGNETLNLPPTNGNVFNQANSMCNSIKASGVEVYVISFQLDKTQAQRVALINNCATDAAHVIDGDTQSLDAAFASIANKLLAMRITQ